MYQAFRQATGSIVAVVGGGGNTGLIFRLAEQAAARGDSVVVTTTARLWPVREVSEHELIERPTGELAAAVGAALAAGKIVIAATSHLDDGRLLGLERDGLGPLALLEPGMIAMASDGAAHKQFKAPAEHEPAIPPEATDVVVCVGLEVLGMPLTEEFVHRAQIVADLSGGVLGEPVTADIITAVLLHAEGGRKNVPEAARLHVLLNAPPTDEHEKLAVHIAQRVVFGGYCRAVVGDSATGEVKAVVQ